jgi:hypothetical protein
MFTLAFDCHHRILLARVSGVVGSGDVAVMDAAMQRFAARHGPTHDLVDFTGVSTVAVPIGKLVRPAVNGSGYSRIVVAKGSLVELARTGAPPSVIVASLNDALQQLGATDPSFEPVDPS